MAPQERDPKTGLDIGLPMVSKWDPEALEKEEQELIEIGKTGPLARLAGYTKLSGPGWLQAALTLGSGSASGSLWAGALLGYSILWSQPFAMIIGVIMMMALAHQTLSTRVRPFQAVERFAHPSLAWGWALSSLLASLIWSLPQYSVCGAAFKDIAGIVWPSYEAPLWGRMDDWGPALVVTALTLYVTWNYGKSGRGIRLFEHVLKILVVGIVLAFFLVVVRTGVDWGAFFKGMFGIGHKGIGFHVPRDAAGMGVLITGAATAVGINMTFLFPYTLLARGWGKEHRSLAKFDLGIGMFIPFVLATSFIVIAAANTLNPEYVAKVDPIQTRITALEKEDPRPADYEARLAELNAELADAKAAARGKMRSATYMATSLEHLLQSKFWSHVIFGLGIAAMAISSIIMLMLVSGFIMAELTHTEVEGLWYKVGLCMPAVGILGPLVWSKHYFWMAVPTSSICFLFLPIAYVSFFLLNNNKKYLGEDRPEGGKRIAWNVAMGLSILVVTVGGFYNIWKNIEAIIAKISGSG